MTSRLGLQISISMQRRFPKRLLQVDSGLFRAASGAKDSFNPRRFLGYTTNEATNDMEE